ncbi:MAG: hypothetical protein RSD57_00635 [Comamonas sp.]
MFYVEKLIERYTAIWRELEAFKAQQEDAEPSAADDEAPNMPDAARTDLATEQQHAPL